MTGPRLVPVRQHFPDDAIADLPAAIRAGIRALDLRLPPGAEVAIAVGSRGVSPIL